MMAGEKKLIEVDLENVRGEDGLVDCPLFEPDRDHDGEPTGTGDCRLPEETRCPDHGPRGGWKNGAPKNCWLRYGVVQIAAKPVEEEE